MDEHADLHALLVTRRAALEEAAAQLQTADRAVADSRALVDDSVRRLRAAEEQHQQLAKAVYDDPGSFQKLSRQQVNLDSSARSLQVLRDRIRELEAAHSHVVDEQVRARERVAEASRAVDAVRARLERHAAESARNRDRQRARDDDEKRLQHWHQQKKS